MIYSYGNMVLLQKRRGKIETKNEIMMIKQLTLKCKKDTNEKEEYNKESSSMISAVWESMILGVPPPICEKTTS